jgi:hypothetical protein
VKVSDYQVAHIVKNYMKNVRMKTKAYQKMENGRENIEDTVYLSQEGLMKVRERIDESLRSKVRRNEETT